jgi:hypothetical protein
LHRSRCALDYQFFRPPASRFAWLFTHFGSMIAAYIATVSAFSAVNFHFINPVRLRWLWPTAVGSLVITFYTARYQAKLAQGARLEQLVTVREARGFLTSRLAAPDVSPQPRIPKVCPSTSRTS